MVITLFYLAAKRLAISKKMNEENKIKNAMETYFSPLRNWRLYCIEKRRAPITKRMAMMTKIRETQIS